MDKYEYKHLVEQIQSLIEQGEYAQAAEIADKIDWRRVRSVMTLGTISDLYKINGRYEDARDVMLLAYDRKPENRQICYSLCELYIKTGEPVEAAEFYKEFEKLAPKDPGRYVLKYKLYDAYDVSLDEKIEVLEKLKGEEYQEKWMYELANLYHKRGLGTKCVEVCDEIILWFGSGKYVNMAMELKMLHEPLTPEQQKKYDSRFENNENDVWQTKDMAEAEPSEQPAVSAPQGEENEALLQQQTIVFPVKETVPTGEATQEWNAKEVEKGISEQLGDTRVFNPAEVRQKIKDQAAEKDDFDIQVKTVDVGQYNTMNLQAEIAAGLKEILENQEKEKENGRQEISADAFATRVIPNVVTSDSGPLDLPLTEDIEEEDLGAGEENKEKASESIENSEVFFETQKEPYLDENGYFHEVTEEPAEEKKENRLKKEAMTAQPPEAMAKVLTQEADGQLKLVVPESKNLEKQITGQLSIEDIRAEWERMKQESQAKQDEEVRQQVLRQTGRMFTEFEEAIRDNILRQMEGDIDPNSFTEPEQPLEEENESVEVNSAQAPKEESAFEFAGFPVGTEEIRDKEPQAEEPKEESIAESEAMKPEGSAAEPETEKPEENAAEPETEKPEENAAEPETEKPEENAAEPETEKPEENAAEPETEKPEENAAEPETEKPEENAAEPETEKTEGSAAEPETEKTEGSAAEPGTEKAEEPEDEFAMESLKEEVPEAEEKAEEALGHVFHEELSWGEEALIEEELEQTLKRNNSFASLDREKTQGSESEDNGIEYESLSKGEEEEEPDREESFVKRFSMDEVEDDFARLEDEEDLKVETPESVKEEKKAEEEVREEKSGDENVKEVRNLTAEEEALYDPWIRDDSDRAQIAKAIDGVSMAAYVGNMVITGETGLDIVELAKKMIYEIKMSDSNFSGKVAKIPGGALNKKDVGQLLDGLKNGALIIENACSMPDKAAEDLLKNLQRENFGIIVILTDTKKNFKKFWKTKEELKPLFNVYVDVQPMSNEALAEFGRQYALEREYSIDNLGMLALHMKIDELQSARHAVNTEDVKEMMDDAIYSASRRTFGHFMDIIFGRRYDDEDMIIITEKDFA